MLEFLEWAPDRGMPLGHAAGCNLLISLTTFERTGGFQEHLWPGEDTVFSVSFAAERTLVSAPRAQVTHLNPVGARAVLAHQRRLGASWVAVCARVTLRGGSLGVPYLARSPCSVGCSPLYASCIAAERPLVAWCVTGRCSSWGWWPGGWESRGRRVRSDPRARHPPA